MAISKEPTVVGAVEAYSPKFKLLANIGRAIGRSLNGDVYEKLDKIETRIVGLEDQRSEDKAVDARRRVINFADNIRQGDRSPSEENYNDVMDDITFYENYCDAHRDFKNEKAIHSIQFVKEKYSEFLRGEE